MQRLQIWYHKHVKTLDRGHDDFMTNMQDDPSVDTDRLREHYGQNYTQMLGLNLASERIRREEEYRQERDEFGR